MKIPDHIAERELDISFKRLSVDLANLSVKMIAITENCQHIVNEELNGYQGQVPLSNLAFYLVQKVALHCKIKHRAILHILSFIFAVLPFVTLFWRLGASAFLMSPAEYVYSVQGFIQSYMSFNLFIKFILVGYYDFNRKKKLQAQCTALISNVDEKYLEMEGCRPKLDILNIQTVMSWYYMRKAFLDFGRRYTVRVFLYFSLVFPVCLLSIILVFLMMFDVIGKRYLALFIPGVYLIIVVVTILSFLVSAAVSLNRYFAIHRDVLLNLVAELRAELYTYACPVKLDEKAIGTMMMVVEKLK